MSAGYSDTPLSERLGLTDGMNVWCDSMPEEIRAEIDEEGLKLTFCDSPDDAMDVACIFVTCEASLTSKIADLAECKHSETPVWVSWPGSDSAQETDVDEQSVRRVALHHGFIAVEKCAVDATWSGIKFVTSN